MVVNAIVSITAWIPSVTHTQESISQLLWKLPINWIVVAQAVKDPDILGQISRSFDHFVKTGQIWAMLIGIVIGYVLRGLSSYG